MEPPLSLTVSPVSQQIDPAAMDDQPQSLSVSYLDSCDMDGFDPALGAAFGDFSEEELFDLFKDDIAPPTLEQEQHPQYPQQQQQWDSPGDQEEGGKEQFVQQPQRVRHEQGILNIPTAESSMKPHFPTQSLDLDDSNSIEESLSISTTSTCTRHGGNAYDKAPARNTSCTTWSTTSSSEESDDGSISICTAPIVISNNVKERQSKPSMSTPIVTDYDPDQEEKSTKPLTVSSGAGTPILPFTFAPAFGPLGGNNPIATAAISSLPNIGELAYAAATGWKRLRSPETNADGEQASGPQDSGQRRLLSSSTRKGQTNSRTSKRAKKEERLMKNREAANRSRIKRKEVLNELENRAETLSKSLASSREDNDTLKQEIASLREQNSFLRGVLSATGITKELPPVLPTSTNQQRQQHGSGGGGGGGGGRVATGANAVVGAIGTALAVVSCVALSATGYDMENGSHDGSGVAQTAGRRTLMSNDDFDPIPGNDFSNPHVSWFGAGVRYLTQREVIQLVGIVVVLAAVFSLLFFLAREAYDMAVRRVNGRERRTSVMRKAFATKSRRSGPWWMDFGVCKIQ